MKKIKIKIIHTGSLKLFVKHTLHILFSITHPNR